MCRDAWQDGHRCPHPCRHREWTQEQPWTEWALWLLYARYGLRAPGLLYAQAEGTGAAVRTARAQGTGAAVCMARAEGIGAAVRTHGTGSGHRGKCTPQAVGPRAAHGLWALGPLHAWHGLRASELLHVRTEGSWGAARCGTGTPWWLWVTCPRCEATHAVRPLCT